jgi:hypothetical protein
MGARTKVRVLPVKQVRLEYLARHPRPLKMATCINYNEIAAVVAELYEMRRKFGPLRERELEIPVAGLCVECREDIVDGVCRCYPRE